MQIREIEPHEGALAVNMKSLIPNLGVESISQTVTYYQDFFGFSLQMAVSEEYEGIGVWS